MALTDRAIRNAKPRKTVYRLRDGTSLVKGFGITIAPSGSKTFFLNYTSPANGKRTQVSLGRYPGISLKEAREKAQGYRDRLSVGADPKDEIKRERNLESKLASRTTLEALFLSLIYI